MNAGAWAPVLDGVDAEEARAAVLAIAAALHGPGLALIGAASAVEPDWDRVMLLSPPARAD